LNTVYQLLAELVMLLHFGFLAYVTLGGFLAYVTLGGFLAWRWPWLVAPHVVAWCGVRSTPRSAARQPSHGSTRRCLRQ
jgi:hypothetical protein